MTRLLLLSLLPSLLLAATAGAATPRAVLRDAQERVVKLFGAGGLSGLEAYQTGLIVSADGSIATVYSSVLDGGGVTVVTIDGSRRTGEVVAADPVADIAIVKVDPAGESMAYWELDQDQATGAAAGEPVWALANLFGIATGNEPVSVLQGVVAAVAPLNSAGGDRPPGESLVLDLVTSNPGAAGGAVIDHRGRLLGMLGRERRAAATGAWVSHAIPAAELARVVGRLLADEAEAESSVSETPLPVDLLTAWGFALAPDIGKRTPPFVDYVAPGGAADVAGLRADDLIVLWGGRIGATRREVLRLAADLAPAEVSVQRAGRLIDLRLPTPANRATADPASATLREEETP